MPNTSSGLAAVRKSKKGAKTANKPAQPKAQSKLFFTKLVAQSAGQAWANRSANALRQPAVEKKTLRLDENGAVREILCGSLVPVGMLLPSFSLRP